MLEIRRILYPTDFSETAEQALQHALFLAEQFEAELHMLHAVVLHAGDSPDGERKFPEPPDILHHLFEIADSEMARLLEKTSAKTFTLREAKVRGFAAGEVILEYAANHDVDLIVMGTHGRRGPARVFLGSVAQEIVRHANCPVLTLRRTDEPREIQAIENILVPVDFSDHSSNAVAYARQLGTLYGAKLQLLHAIEEPVYPYFYTPAGGYSVPKQLEELRGKAEEALEKVLDEAPGPPIEVDKFVVTGRPSTEVARFAVENDTDMIVIATHGLSGIERLLLGSTSEQVVRLAECPVFTVKSYGKNLL